MRGISDRATEKHGGSTMTPKFKSFQAVQVPNHIGTQTDVFVYALGEDGIVYMTDAIGKNNWWPLLNTEVESTLEKEGV